MEKYSCKPSINRSFIKSDGTASVFLLIYINSRKLTIPLGISWPVTNFDDVQGKLLPLSKLDKNAMDYNLVISSAVQKVHDIFKQYRLMDAVLTPERFKQEYKGYTCKKDFVLFYRQKLEVRYRTREIDENSYRVQKTSLNSLVRFNENLPFNEINRDVIKKYINKMKRDGLTENTIWARIKDMKTYLNIAKKENINFQWPFDQLMPNEKPKYRSTNKVFLTKAELQELFKLLNSEISPGHKHILVKYLFSCVTGLRISDNKKVSSMDIIGDELIFVMQKNKRRLGKLVKIPLSSLAKELLEKHHNSLMISYSEPVINRMLKDIADLAQIKKKLTFHTARHTFATLFLEMGGSVEVLSELLGHTSIKTTMVYVHITSEHRKKQMRLMDGLLL